MDRHLLSDARPSDYFNSSETFPDAEFPFTLLRELKNTRQSPQYHPEGSVWNHTMMVVDEAAKRKAQSTDERVFMWAALLHDIGKPATTKIRKGKITSYDHDKEGSRLAENFLNFFGEDPEFVRKVAALIRWHMQILYVVKSLPYADIQKMKEQTSVDDVALLGFCDRLGRLGADPEKERENIALFIAGCRKIM